VGVNVADAKHGLVTHLVSKYRDPSHSHDSSKNEGVATRQLAQRQRSSLRPLHYSIVLNLINLVQGVGSCSTGKGPQRCPAKACPINSLSATCGSLADQKYLEG
jgi:hypothetical protein